MHWQWKSGLDKVLLEMFTPWIYEAPGKVIETVVVKKALDQEEKKLFYKEVALLNGLNHPNIVKMKGVCQNPLISQTTDFHFAKLQNLISQTTDFHFVSFRSISFRIYKLQY